MGVDCQYFKDMEMKGDKLGDPTEESSISIKPSSPATNSTVVETSQSGEWI